MMFEYILVMKKSIHKSDYLDGLTLCEKNGLRLLSFALKKYNLGDYLSAFIFALASFEEFMKVYMIV